MNVIKLGEAINDTSELFIKRILHELDFTHVKLADTLDLETSRDLSRGLSLCLGQGDINQLS
jgi:hypothetical protein